MYNNTLKNVKMKNGNSPVLSGFDPVYQVNGALKTALTKMRNHFGEMRPPIRTKSKTLPSKTGEKSMIVPQALCCVTLDNLHPQ